MTQYYIASGLTNIEPVRALKKILDDAGWQHTYDWTVQQGDTLADTGYAEMNAITVADVVIVLLPGGRGTHAALGAAVGQTVIANALVDAGIAREVDRRIVIFSGTPSADFHTRETTSVFYHHPYVERFDDIDVMIASLLKGPR